MLSEWKVLPEYVYKNWSMEKIVELIGNRAERLLLSDPNAPKKPRKISDVEMLKLLNHDPAAIRRLADAQ